MKSDLVALGTEMPDRSIGTSTLLPVTASKDKDGKTKEENLKLLNGNSLDSLDFVCGSPFILNNLLILFVVSPFILNNLLCTSSTKRPDADSSFSNTVQRPRTQMNGKNMENGNDNESGKDLSTQ